MNGREKGYKVEVNLSYCKVFLTSAGLSTTLDLWFALFTVIPRYKTLDVFEHGVWMQFVNDATYVIFQNSVDPSSWMSLAR